PSAACAAAGIVTVALVLALRRTGVTRYLALWSSDFPHAARLPDRRAAIRPPSLTRAVYRSSDGGPGFLPGRGEHELPCGTEQDCEEAAHVTPGRRTTDAGPPAMTRSMASLHIASARVFCARGTC